jgi:hypothetical protein
VSDVLCIVSSVDNHTVWSIVHERPRRVNRGQGGHNVQLQAFAELITEKRGKQTKSMNIPQDAPVNTMAPAKKGRQSQKVS